MAGNEVDLAQAAARLRGRLPLILAFGTAAALLVAVVTLWVLPAQYRASANVVIMTPRGSSELRSPLLSSPAYERIAASEAVVSKALSALLDDGVVDQQGQLKLRRNLETRIIELTNTPTAGRMLELTATASEASRAAHTANRWAESFLAHIAEVSDLPTRESIDLALAEFEAAMADLETAERAEEERARELDREYAQLAVSLDRKSAARLAKLEAEIEDYQLETRRQIDKLAPDFLGNGGRRTLPTESTSELEGKLLELMSLRQQLAQTPPSWRLAKSISDEALWQSVTEDGEPIDSFSGLELVTEEVNPLFTDLTKLVTTSERQVRLLGAGLEDLQPFLLELERIQRQRSSGLMEKLEDKHVQLRALSYERDTELASFQRQKNVEMGRLRRESRRLREFTNGLAERYGEAVRAQAELGALVVGRLVTAATEPPSPEPRFVVLRMLIAFLLAAAASAGLILIGIPRPNDQRPHPLRS